jgi:hypothetical protein
VLSLKTVRNRVSAVLATLGVSTRAEAVVKARQAGLSGPDRPTRLSTVTAAAAASTSGSTPDDL